MGRLALWLLVVAACSGGTSQVDAIVADTRTDTGPDPNDGARSGSRLKLSWITFADGTRQLQGYYDAERKENCYLYTNFIDGNSYCVPADVTSSIVYSNASCTARIAEVYKDATCPAPAPKYAIEYQSTGCQYRPAHLYLRGAQTALANYYFRASDGTCQGPYTTSPTYYNYYTLGAEILMTDLVRVTESAPANTGRLGLRYYQSDDGMRRPGTINDAMFGVSCYPSVFGEGTDTGVCTLSASYAGYTQDSACMLPKLGVSAACPKPQYMVFYDDNNACPTAAPRYYATGNTVAGSPLYFQSAGSCVATTPSPTTTYYSAGTELQLAPVTRALDAAGTHRLQIARFTTPEGFSARDYSLFDTSKNTRCYASTLPDDTIRCLPAGGYISTFYTNATCTSTIDVVMLESGPSSCGMPTPPAYASKYVAPPPGSCQYSREIHTVTTLYTGPLYQLSGSCQLYTPTNQKPFRVGPIVPLTDFMPGTIETDP